MRIAPSSAVNSCMAISGGVKSFLDRGKHTALDRKRVARNPRARCRRVAAAAELRGDFVHVHLVALGAEADARQLGLQFFKNTGHDDRFNGADVVNQTSESALSAPVRASQLSSARNKQCGHDA